MKLILSKKNKPSKKDKGLYYWTDSDACAEHTPCVLFIENGYAEGEEYSFNTENDDGLYCRIPNPIIDGEEVEPYSL